MTDNFYVKIVIVLLLCGFFCPKINCGYTHNLFFSKKVKKNVFTCLNTSVSIKVWYIRWSELHEPVFKIKRF